MNPVSADHEVVRGRIAVAELDRERPVSPLQAANVDTHPDRHLCRPFQQHGVEIRSLKREAGSDAVPQPRHVDLDEESAPVIAHTLARDDDGLLDHRVLKVECAEGAGRVTGQVDAGTGLLPGPLPLHDFGREPGTGERSGGAETGDASADDEDAR